MGSNYEHKYCVGSIYEYLWGKKRLKKYEDGVVKAAEKNRNKNKIDSNFNFNTNINTNNDNNIAQKELIFDVIYPKL